MHVERLVNVCLFTYNTSKTSENNVFPHGNYHIFFIYLLLSRTNHDQTTFLTFWNLYVPNYVWLGGWWLLQHSQRAEIDFNCIYMHLTTHFLCSKHAQFNLRWSFWHTWLWRRQSDTKLVKTSTTEHTHHMLWFGTINHRK